MPSPTWRDVLGRHPLAERLPDERKSIGISPQHAELLTASWSSVHSEDLDTLR
jgi:hypothetical protein